MRKSTLISIGILLLIYVFSYGYFRQTNIEIWEKDNQAYEIFPTDKIFLYYLFRPISYLDGKLTGMSFHIGPNH